MSRDQGDLVTWSGKIFLFVFVISRKAFRALSDPPQFSMWLSVPKSFGFVVFSFRCDIPKHLVFCSFDVVEI